jgi:phosphoglycerate kinase
MPVFMEKEIAFLGAAREDPQRPVAAIVGGAKVSDKIAVVEHFIGMVDVLLIGGGMANTLLKARGFAVGDSLVEDEKLDVAREVIAKARQRDLTLLLPIDVVIVDRFAADADRKTVPVEQVPQGWRIMDIGPQTVKAFDEALAQAQTIIWNGTLGVAEMPAFARGTDAIIAMLVERTQQGAITIIGGGDSAAAVDQAGAAERMTHVSTGGGASLEEKAAASPYLTSRGKAARRGTSGRLEHLL